MGVVYFSIIPTFEPSRYCKCWIVCFYNNNLLYYFPYSGFIINSYVTKCGLFAYMAENIFDFRHVDVYCQYYSFKNDISYKSAKSL